MLRFPKDGLPALCCLFSKDPKPGCRCCGQYGTCQRHKHAGFISGLHSRIALQRIASQQRRLHSAAIRPHAFAARQGFCRVSIHQCKGRKALRFKGNDAVFKVCRELKGLSVMHGQHLKDAACALHLRGHCNAESNRTGADSSESRPSTVESARTMALISIKLPTSKR